MKTTAGTRLRVGIFVLVALVIGASIAFSIGAQENIFESKTTYHAIFRDVGGLQKGNTVRVAGVSVGSVTDVLIGESGQIEVYFRIIDDATHLIRGEPGAIAEIDGLKPSHARGKVNDLVLGKLLLEHENYQDHLARHESIPSIQARVRTRWSW